MKKDKNKHGHDSNYRAHSQNFSHPGKVPLKYRIRHLWHKIENSFLFVALASFFWLIYKSGTKPSRIVYPCQRAAAANLGFAIFTLPSPLFLYSKKLKNYFIRDFELSRLFLLIFTLAAIFGLFLAIDYYDNTKPVNSPVGSGIHGKVLSQSEQIKLGAQSKYATIPGAYDLPSPHRVVSVHNSKSSTWEGRGNPNNYMNQNEIDKMVDAGIMELTGTTSPQEGWRKIIPYKNGQSVAIKLNFNNNRDYAEGLSLNDDSNKNMLNYAAVVNSVIRGLKSAGVPSDKIWITDPSRPIHDQFRERIYDKGVQYYVNQNCKPYLAGRPNVYVTGYVPESSADASTSTAYAEKIRPAQVFADATYIINMPQLKGHGFANVGRVTLSLKNNFGSVYYTAEDTHGNAPAHKAKPFAKLLADINNNRVFRDKTRLVVVDGIMGNPDVNYGPPTLWRSFGNKPPETLFFGVDPVATDSVMVDYIKREAGSQAKGLVQSYAADLGLGVSESWDNQKNYACIDYHPIDLDNVISWPEPVAFPVADFSADQTSGVNPLTVSFTDKSTGATGWKWNFGDRSAYSYDQNPVHTYSTAGTYTVKLTTINTAERVTQTKTGYITVTSETPVAPASDFFAVLTSGTAPLTVSFTDKSTGATGWKWNFGDGSGYSYDQNPVHTYSKAGTYTVKLTAINAAGRVTQTKTDYITVKAGLQPLKKPVAAFAANKRAGKTPFKVQFVDKSANVPTSWKWNFGDGKYSTAKNPVHTYTKAGKCKVSLTVKNKAGTSTKAVSSYIVVSKGR